MLQSMKLAVVGIISMSRFRQRVRDPIHGLIVFENEIDKIAWELIETPEFQRLRRIKQLGFSEFTFPGATHSRFAHSIGVYHNARKLMRVIQKREGNSFKPERANEILIAALLHDLGHGPFSHAFEEVQKSLNDGQLDEDHEAFTAKIIQNENGNIAKILQREKIDSGRIAALFKMEEPEDVYHAVISSSFDADRLDFLVRDRYMTGTGSGAIDEEWLIDNLKEHKVPLLQDDDEDSEMIPTFVFKHKGRQAAEDFLLSRYRLYKEVYLHKTTRGFEAMLKAILTEVAKGDFLFEHNEFAQINPVIQFLRGTKDINTYLRMDDSSVWFLLRYLADHKHGHVSKLSKRLLDRDHLHVIDVNFEFPGRDAINAIENLEHHFGDEFDKSIFRDDPPINLYSTDDGETEKVHKIIRVLDANGTPQEITEFAETIISSKLTEKTPLIRYYFLSKGERDSALEKMKGR